MIFDVHVMEIQPEKKTVIRLQESTALGIKNDV